MRIDKRIWLLASIAGCEAAGLVGSVFAMQSISTWYMGLNKPQFTPPGWVFGPVWTALYALMGISLYMVWRAGKKGASTAYALFAVQLALNVLWSALFFGLRSTLYGLVDIIALWFAVLATAVAFNRISRGAALALVPYLAWVTVALALNFLLWRLN